MTTVTDRYASRTDRMSAILARQDPVVYGQGTYTDALSVDQVSSYEQNGFLLLEEVFLAEEVAELVAEVERMCADPAIAGRDYRSA